jgi:hypothetical protein
MKILILFALFVTKHFIVDFVLQKPYQWMNKGNYGHPGGILHAVLHGIGTWAILNSSHIPVDLIIELCCMDIIVHYHIDWAKMNINKKMGWASNTHEEFWILTGFDQFLHYMTYILILYFVIDKI